MSRFYTYDLIGMHGIPAKYIFVRVFIKEEKQYMEDKNFGLTEASFAKMALDLQANDTRFFEQVFLRQFEETMEYVKRKYNADRQDAYDATIDALLAFRLRFVQGKLSYGNLRFLFTKMASQLYLKSLKRSRIHVDAALHLERDIEPEEGTDEPPAEFSRAWKKLGQPCKQLLVNYYYGKMKLLEIAQELSKKPETIRKQKERCIDKLKGLMVEIK